MANAVYPKFKEAALSALLNAADVRAILIDTTAAEYAYDPAHEFLSDVPVAARVAVSPTLTTLSFTDGKFNSDDPLWSNVSGDEAEAVLLYIHTGTDATSRLIAYIDANQTGLPVLPNGGNIGMTVDEAGWFGLGS